LLKREKADEYSGTRQLENAEVGRKNYSSVINNQTRAVTLALTHG
jgi:hypothetical protein